MESAITEHRFNSPLHCTSILEPDGTGDDLQETEWDKVSVQYALKHNKKVLGVLKGLLSDSANRGLNIYDAGLQEFYDDLIEHLYKASDFDPKLASQTSNNPQMAYIVGCAKKCIQRRKTEVIKHQKRFTYRKALDHETEVDILDVMPDVSALAMFDNLSYDLDSSLRAVESKRYRYGADIFLVLFIRYLLNMEHLTCSKVNIFGVMGISRNDILELKRSIRTDEDIMHLMKAMSLMEPHEVLGKLRNYVYSSRLLIETIHSLSVS